MPKTKKQPSQEEIDIVIARLELVSPELHFASGSSFKGFSREDMIKEIKNNTKIGNKFVATEFEFLRAIKDGSLKKILINSNN